MRAYNAGRAWWRRLLVRYRPSGGCASILLPAHGIHGVAASCSAEVGLVPAVNKLGKHGSRSDLWRALLQERLCNISRESPSLLQQRRGFLGIGDGDEDPGASLHFEEDRIIGYSPEQVYAIVAAVDMYEDFVPWCQSSRVLWCKEDEALDAELKVGFKLFLERYISHVELKRPHLIKTTVSQSNLFDHLNNEWSFKPGPTPNSCHLHFKVDFQFRSPLYRQVANMFQNEVQARMVSSFEERCRLVYGLSMVH